MAYGTFDGVYFQDLREPNREPVKVLALTDVARVDVLDDYGRLIVLSGGSYVFLRSRRLTVTSCRGSGDYVPHWTHLRQWIHLLG